MTEQESLVGRVVRGFRVEEILGTGGMGNVYLGRHETIDSKVAIKVLHPEYVSDADMERRFLDEARAVNRVEHPGLVKISDCGQEDGVGVFLVMELLSGRTLRDRLRQEGPLPPPEVARVVGQVVSALEAVHRVGIIHRDLKPENIMLIPDPYVPGGERVKILDFGIAKLLERGARIGEVTRTGHIFGSPMYMSPEQCADTKSVDHRTDIYALGVIAYELVCGSTPFVADSIYDLVRKHLTTRPALPSSRSHLVPEAMGRAILKALAFELEDRYQNVAAFGAALEASLEGLPAFETIQWAASPGHHVGGETKTAAGEPGDSGSLDVVPTMLVKEAQSASVITTEPPAKLKQAEAHRAITKDSAGRKIVIEDRSAEADAPGDGGPPADTEMSSPEVDSGSPTLRPAQDTLPVIGEVATVALPHEDREAEGTGDQDTLSGPAGPADTVNPPLEVPWHRRAAIPVGLALAGALGVVLVVSLDDAGDPVRLKPGGVEAPSNASPRPPSPKAGPVVVPPATQRGAVAPPVEAPAHTAQEKRPREVVPDAGQPRATAVRRPPRKARRGRRTPRGGQPTGRRGGPVRPIPPGAGAPPVKKATPSSISPSPKARKSGTDYRFHELSPGSVKKKTKLEEGKEVHGPGGLKKDLRYRRIKHGSGTKD